MSAIPAERLVFLDESGGAPTNLVRLHGWSPRGGRAWGTTPCGCWERGTILGALGLEGVVGAMSIAAATDATGRCFRPISSRCGGPSCAGRVKPDAVLVMDNLNAHKTKAVRALPDGAGFTYRYLPSYSPGPWGAALPTLIERAWAKVKAGRRQAAAHTGDGLHAALGPALDAITAQDAQGFFRPTGYACPN